MAVFIAPLTLGLIGLAVAIVLWGLAYKLSLYHSHQNRWTRVSVAKLWVSPSGGEKAVRSFSRLTLPGFGFLVILAAALGQRSAAFMDKPTAIGTGNLELSQRKELPSEAVSAEGLIRLDATVTDQAGKAVAGLQRDDFRLLDNGQPQRIIAFRASKSVSAGRRRFTIRHLSP